MNANNFWERNLILHMLSGSRAYGLARADSDEDTRGVCIPPKEYLLGLKRFEQYENETHDHTIFALDKFIRLALAANPNIIEMLYTDIKFILFLNPYGERLLQARDIFLSRRVGESFSRYAISQLHRMENHHPTFYPCGRTSYFPVSQTTLSSKDLPPSNIDPLMYCDLHHSVEWPVLGLFSCFSCYPRNPVSILRFE